MREHNIAVSSLDFITGKEAIAIDYPEGAAHPVTMHDGTTLVLRKLDATHDLGDRAAALTMLAGCRATGEIPTGLIYVDREAEELHDTMNTTLRPLNELTEAELCPGSKALGAINASMR